MTDETSKTYVFGNDGGSVPMWAAMNNGGLFGGNNPWGGGIIGFILGLLFGNGGLGGGLLGGNGGAAAASLGAQATANNNADLILQAINGNRDAISSLATTLNSDFNSVQTALTTINNGINSVGAQVGMSGLQVINAIQSGNATLASQLSQCCCENRLLTTTQGYESQIRTLEQTTALSGQADRNANSIINAINAQTVSMNDNFCEIKQRELQMQIDAKNDIINQLRAQANNQTILNQVAAMLNPIVNQVNTIAAKQPNTISVVYPNLEVSESSTTPAATGN